MMKNVSFFQTASALARHASLRNSVISENIANADTPKYLARRVETFEDTFSNDSLDTHMKRTRSNHFSDDSQSTNASIQEVRRGVDPNGNSVSLESEMVQASSASGQHDRALALYSHGLKILRLSLGRQ